MPCVIVLNPCSFIISRYRAKNIPNDGTNHAESLLDWDPGTLRAFRSKMIDPYWGITVEKSLEETKNEPWDEKPEVSVIVCKYETWKCITNTA